MNHDMLTVVRANKNVNAGVRGGAGRRGPGDAQAAVGDGAGRLQRLAALG